jgi:Na+/H+ antiporter NhaD/arsenite permease-like protein
MTTPTFRWGLVAACGLLALMLCPDGALASAPTTGPGEPSSAHGISLAWAIPFVLLLAAIALMPFIHRHWWEHNYPYVAVGLGLVVAGYYWLAAPSASHWLDEMKEYVSFIALLGSLFVVSGGISIRVNRKATPLANCVMLAIGAIIANIFGTTGASMLLIRPYLRMNRGHIKPYHIVFFIFIVSNCGGALTPIGDPPLFLGYLKGVPFWWVAEHLWPLWATAVGLLLAIFYVLDARDHAKQERLHHGDAGAQVHILGIHNFLFIGLILFAVFRDSVFEAIGRLGASGVSVGSLANLVFSRELLMLYAAIGARRLTARLVFDSNEFTYGPIREVAILFVGIFSTLVPALQWLNTNADRVGVHTPGQFYFSSGSLSSVLDNAPTYLTFLQTRIGELDRQDVEETLAEVRRLAEGTNLPMRADLRPNVRDAVSAVARYHPEIVRKEVKLSEDELRTQAQIGLLVGVPAFNVFIVAISAGAVFFGACTYIGNGPNFMVKSIAEAAGVQCPSFIGYVARYTLPFLLPVYILVWYIFLR